MLERSSQLEYVARRMCQRREVNLGHVERTPDGGGRFQITNGKVGSESKIAWCTVDAATLKRGHSEELVEAVAIALALGIDELQGTPAALTFAGRFRVHFNHHGAAPLVWCVATDSWELAVREVAIDAPVATIYKPKATPDHEDGRPSAWLEVDGTLVVVDGVARITRRAA